MPSEPEPSSADSLLYIDEDTELITALRDGNEDAFVTLMERYHAPMLRLASMYVSKGMAEEVVQDAWLGAFSKGSAGSRRGARSGPGFFVS
jgi:DNA-directed RNA polymerase specialized sigma24 family protein